MNKGVMLVIVAVFLVAVFFVIGISNSPTGRTSTVETDTFTCDDTDGGIDLKIKGTATRTNDRTGSVVTFTDYCADSNLLKEYYCKGDRIKSKTQLFCDCQDGACPDIE